jgi:3-methyladenine DNA glycosylase AlkD
MFVTEIIQVLTDRSSPVYLEGMKRFGIDSSKALGVPMPEIRKLAKSINKDHSLALELWETGIHEARIMASLIDDPKLVTPQQMDTWVKDFHSWDLCDQVCGNLFDRTVFAMERALLYSSYDEEYIKRAAFVLMAEFAAHDKKAENEVFIALLPVIEREAWDDRNFVKKAVNWALRQIGKRNPELRVAAVACANRILLQNTKAAKWIAANALKELSAV